MVALTEEQMRQIGISPKRASEYAIARGHVVMGTYLKDDVSQDEAIVSEIEAQYPTLKVVYEAVLDSLIAMREVQLSKK